MKSLIIDKVHSLGMVEREMPRASGNRMIIKTQYAAICGSDNSLWNGEPYVGMSPCHEFSGIVEDPGVFPFKKGDHVCAAEIGSCGECEFCKSGNEQLCAMLMAECPGVSMDGGFSEYISVRGDYTFKMPDDVPLELGALVEPIAVSLHAVKFCNLKEGDDVLVWGNGPIGIYAAACAKLLGAGKVYMVGRNQGRVDYCNGFDFVDECFSVKNPEFEAKINAVKPALGFEHVIDALGCHNFDPIHPLMKSGGVISIVGMHSPRFDFDSLGITLKEIAVRTSLFFSKQDYMEALDMVCKNQDMFLKTISSRIPHDAEVVQNMFIKLFDSGSNDECKVVVEYAK